MSWHSWPESARIVRSAGGVGAGAAAGSCGFILQSPNPFSSPCREPRRTPDTQQPGRTRALSRSRWPHLHVSAGGHFGLATVGGSIRGQVRSSTRLGEGRSGARVETGAPWFLSLRGRTCGPQSWREGRARISSYHQPCLSSAPTAVLHHADSIQPFAGATDPLMGCSRWNSSESAAWTAGLDTGEGGNKIRSRAKSKEKEQLRRRSRPLRTRPCLLDTRCGYINWKLDGGAAGRKAFQITTTNTTIRLEHSPPAPSGPAPSDIALS